MAQPSGLIFEYLVGKRIPKGTTLNTADAPVGANVVIFRSEQSRVSVNGTDAFTIKYGEVSYFSSTESHTYLFTTEVDLAFAKLVSLPV